MGAYSYSTTAASNTSIDGLGNNGAVDPPSNIDNLVGRLAASDANLVRDLGGANTVAGSADAITVALADASTPTYFDGMVFSFRAASDTTSSAPTLNVDSLGTKTIKRAIAGVESALAAGDIQAGGTYTVVYRSAWASAAGAFELLNPYTYGAIIPAANATYDIGTTSLGINDLHFGSGGIINWNNGDVTLTHAANALTVAGGNLYHIVADGAPNNNTGNNPATAFIDTTGGLDIAAYQKQVIFCNRLDNDGVVISIRQDGTEEGSINVSTTTVSLVGGHLARWTQLVGSNETPLLRGTVLSNVDELCEFFAAVYEVDGKTKKVEVFGDYDDGDEITITDTEGVEHQATVEILDNDQLNKMVMSDVAGDKNVAGVVDFYDEDGLLTVAQSGDYVIRIAKGVTVQRGDLLESNGDGCARPQSDDIIRSKTVAKVSSTVVRGTYEDGSYLVPCVLMAGG
jgi:hypothetical protein